MLDSTQSAPVPVLPSIWKKRVSQVVLSGSGIVIAHPFQSCGITLQKYEIYTFLSSSLQAFIIQLVESEGKIHSFHLSV